MPWAGDAGLNKTEKLSGALGGIQPSVFLVVKATWLFVKLLLH